jgi:hypothetical protein
MEMDGKCDSKTRFFSTIHFSFFWAVLSAFGFEVSKKYKCKQINYVFTKIQYGYHKTKNSMPSSNLLKKMPETFAHTQPHSNKSHNKKPLYKCLLLEYFATNNGLREPC